MLHLSAPSHAHDPCPFTLLSNSLCAPSGHGADSEPIDAHQKLSSEKQSGCCDSRWFSFLRPKRRASCVVHPASTEFALPCMLLALRWVSLPRRCIAISANLSPLCISHTSLGPVLPDFEALAQTGTFFSCMIPLELNPSADFFFFFFLLFSFFFF